jgi:hypothetical protein
MAKKTTKTTQSEDVWVQNEQPKTTLTAEDVQILFNLAQFATIKVSEMEVVSRLLNKCLQYVQENKGSLPTLKKG